jgi:RNA polymerase sigma-70 factor, ECF subfamily
MAVSALASAAALDLERHRRGLVAHCYRMLGSPFDAEDAVQETILRAWSNRDRFDGRAAITTWLYRIATNVCLDMLKGARRRARPMDLGAAGEPVLANLHVDSSQRWIEPLPDSLIDTDDPAEAAIGRESVRLALVAALQRLPARQRAALLMHDVLRWDAGEIAELLDTTSASVHSGLQRARATLARSNVSLWDPQPPLSAADRALLERYVVAFERYDLDALTSLIREDAQQSMPPYDLWLRGREDILAWWFGPGIACSGSRLVPARANASPTFAQYKPAADGTWRPWALQVVEIEANGIAEMTFFLDTARLFPLFGLPAQLTGAGAVCC